jgi:hypothetical protein
MPGLIASAEVLLAWPNSPSRPRSTGGPAAVAARAIRSASNAGVMAHAVAAIDKDRSVPRRVMGDRDMKFNSVDLDYCTGRSRSFDKPRAPFDDIGW